MVAASSPDTIPGFASMSTCAFDPAMSCRHNRLSNGMEAFISRMTEAGPSAKRPPHMLLEPAVVRSVIAILLLVSLPVILSACDRQSGDKEQENAQATAVQKSENSSGGESTFSPAIDTSHAGDTAPRSEEHTSELQSLMRISYAVFCL